MLEAFELDWLRAEIAEEHRGVLAWLSFMADAGGDHGWDLGIAQAPGRHLEIVPASNCPRCGSGTTTLSTRRQSIGWESQY